MSRRVTNFSDSSDDDEAIRAKFKANQQNSARSSVSSSAAATAASNELLARRRAAFQQQGADAFRASNVSTSGNTSGSSTPVPVASSSSSSSSSATTGRPPLAASEATPTSSSTPTSKYPPNQSGSSGEKAEKQQEKEREKQQAQSPLSITSGRGSPTPPSSSSSSHQQQQQQENVAQQVEELAKLRAQISAKKEELQTAKQKETELGVQLKNAKSEHEHHIKLIEDEAAQIRREADSERQHQLVVIDEASQQHENFLRQERQRIEEDLRLSSDPELKKLEQDVTKLKEDKKNLQGQISSANSSGSEVDKLLTEAITKVVGQMNASFEEKFKADESFVSTVRDLVRGEVKQSFHSRATEEEAEERSQHAKDFEEMLTQWKSAEEQERFHVLRQDEQLLMDLQSIAHESLDVIQKEELALQQSFLAQREQWMRSHRSALQAEMEASLQRTSLEFEEIRGLRRDTFAQKLKDLDEQHLADMQRDRDIYEAKMGTIREMSSMRQKLQDQRTKLVKEVQKEAENAVGELKDVLVSVSGAVDRVDEYRRGVDDAKTVVLRDQERLAAERRVMLEESQQILGEQLEYVEGERKLLAEGTAKLDNVHSVLQRQLGEEKAWAAETHARVERSRTEWEREYRRWQQTAAQERRAAEQRYSDAIRELNGLNAALDEETQAIEAEVDGLHRRTEDRSRTVSSEMEALHQREQQTQKRSEAVSQVVGDLEQRSRQLGMEWQKLQAQKHELLAQRRELEQEESRMLALSEQLHLMRGQTLSLQADASQAGERKRNIDSNILAAREMLGAQGEALRADANRHHNKKHHHDNKRGPTVTVQRGDLKSADRLPLRLMDEIHQMVDSSAPLPSQPSYQHQNHQQYHHHQQYQNQQRHQQQQQQQQQQPGGSRHHHNYQQQQQQQQPTSFTHQRTGGNVQQHQHARSSTAAKVDAHLAKHGLMNDQSAASVSFTPLVNLSEGSTTAS